MSKKLTQKYGFGKLPDGWYYVHLTTPRGIDITPILEMPMGEKCFRDFDERGYELEVLDAVPSYLAWEQANKEIKELSKKYRELSLNNSILEKKFAIALTSLKQYKEAIDEFKADPLNKLVLTSHQLIHDIDVDCNVTLKAIG